MRSFLTNRDMRQIRKNTISKWESLGFLDGLKGYVKEDIAKLYESEASHLLNESHYEKDHKPLAIKNMEEANRINSWSVYMVECSDDTIYTGISNNVSKRISDHNDGKGAKYTRGRLPVALKWLKTCKNKSEASKYEHKIKKLPKKEKLKLIEDYER